MSSAALDAGVDPAIHFGGWTRLQRRALVMAVGASEAAYADAKAAATPPVKKAPARPPVDVAPAKAVSPAPSTVTQPASERSAGPAEEKGGTTHLEPAERAAPAEVATLAARSRCSRFCRALRARAALVTPFFFRSPWATWTREHAEAAAAAMNYVSALAFYAAMGRGELQ
ncbi:unnamed protein product, partial [Symbiodinium necroappetens]